jgi:AcrR family transcriptional regulator
MSREYPLPAAITDEQQVVDREMLLDVSESLIYARGVQAVGMDQIREASGLSLKRIYALFATKEELVVETLRRRDLRWRAGLVNFVEQFDEPTRRVLAIFDWLHDWFTEPGFRGCAWINIHGELGPISQAVRDEVRSHKKAFHDQIAAWTDATGTSAAESIYLLAEGAIVTAGINGDPDVATRAQNAARLLLARSSAFNGRQQQQAAKSRRATDRQRKLPTATTTNTSSK